MKLIYAKKKTLAYKFPRLSSLFPNQTTRISKSLHLNHLNGSSCAAVIILWVPCFEQTSGPSLVCKFLSCRIHQRLKPQNRLPAQTQSLLFPLANFQLVWVVYFFWALTWFNLMREKPHIFGHEFFNLAGLQKHPPGSFHYPPYLNWYITCPCQFVLSKWVMLTRSLA